MIFSDNYTTVSLTIVRTRLSSLLSVGCKIPPFKLFPNKVPHIIFSQVLFGNVYLNHEPGGKDTAVMGYTVTVEEHTLCECREIPNCNDLVCDSPMIRDPVNCKCKCPKRCPLPYRHNVDTCDCECGDERTQAGRACRKIFRGKQSMNRNECS